MKTGRQLDVAAASAADAAAAVDTSAVHGDVTVAIQFVGCV